MARVNVEMDENDVCKAIADWIRYNYGVSIPEDSLPIEVKSKQNYKSEWENANIRVKVSVTVRDR